MELTLSQKVFIILKVYESTSMYFSHWEDCQFNREELDEVYKSFLSRTFETQSRTDFAYLMWEFFGLLRNAHTWYVDSDITASFRPLGFTFDFVSGQWVVIESSVDSVKVGDSLVSIQGKTIAEWETEIGKYLNARKDSSRKVMLRGSIPAFIDEPTINVVLNDRFDRLQHVSFQRISDVKHRATDGDWIDVNTAYIKIPSFTEPRFEERALQLLSEFRCAKSLIIDLRSNDGGSTPSRLTNALMNVPRKWWMERSVNPPYLFRRHQGLGSEVRTSSDHSYAEAHPSIVKPSEDAYNGKVILLTSRIPGSSAEDFIMPFKDTKRGVIIGESTWGSTGMQYRHDFGNGISFHVGTIRSYFPDGNQFEGIGIEPDILVSLTRDDYYDGHDPVWLKALDIARGDR